MQMTGVIFTLFTIYAVVNSHLSLLLREMGYSATLVGILMSVFEIAGVIVPLVVCPLVEKKKAFGSFLLLTAILMILIPIPLLKIWNPWITALCLCLFAVGYKASVPVSDSMTNALLGAHPERYGMVRASGSFSFVVMNLAMQAFYNIERDGLSILLWWMITPAVFYGISILLVPHIFKGEHFVVVEEHNTELSESLQTSENSSSEPMSSAGFPPVYWLGLTLIFLAFFGLIPANRFLSMYIFEELHSNTTSLMWAISAAAEIPFMFFSYKFLKRFKSLSVIVFCSFVSGIRVLCYVAIPNMAGCIIGQLLNAFTYGLFHPACVLFASEYAPKDRKVLSLTLYSVFAVGLGYILGNVIGGVIIDHAGYKALFLSFGLIPIAAVMLYFAVRPLFTDRNQQKQVRHLDR